jgi:hypothetical protein
MQLFDVLAMGLLISNESLTPQISWDTTIASVIPNWKLPDPVASAQSTITDLMAHRTGLPVHDFAYFLNDSIPAVVHTAILFPPPSIQYIWKIKIPSCCRLNARNT